MPLDSPALPDNPDAPNPAAIQPIELKEEMRNSYLDYALSVILDRALPDVRDGLKPVHRRIFYAMKEGGYSSGKPYKKSARIVGDVMGKYHPHGDSAIYDAMVRMAQDFSMRLPLIDGQGNFGSIDGDPAAAMRYTEARLDKLAEIGLLADIDKDTVDFQPNYDDNEQEPTVLPARLPNLLINGASGIAVGYATNIPPHNPREVLDACIAVVKNPEIELSELLQIIPGPDFPTGGRICGASGIVKAYSTGRGAITLRAVMSVESDRSRGRANQSEADLPKKIVITELPYAINKAKLIEAISELASPGKDKQGKTIPPRIPGIADIRDESDKNIRIVIDLKKDADPEATIALLYRLTPLQTTFGVNARGLLDGTPMLLTLKDILAAFVKHRQVVIRRRSEFELRKDRDTLHLKAGQAVAIDNIDRVISIIRQASDTPDARQALMNEVFEVKSDVTRRLLQVEADRRAEVIGETYRLTEAQVGDILDLKLHKLTGLQRDQLIEEGRKLVARIEWLLEVLNDRSVLIGVLLDELEELRALVDTPRRTQLEAADIDDTPVMLVPKEDVVVILTTDDYIKRIPAREFEAQAKGGKGKAAARPNDGEVVSQALAVNTHDQLVVFTDRGMSYRLDAHRIPAADKAGRGRHIVNVLDQMGEDEKITTILPVTQLLKDNEGVSLLFFTDLVDGGGYNGRSEATVRRSRVADFLNIRSNGKKAMGGLVDDDGKVRGQLVAVLAAKESDDAIVASSGGYVCRFAVADLTEKGSRDSVGNRSIRLKDGEKVVGAAIVPAGERKARAKAGVLPEDAVESEAEEAAIEAAESEEDKVDESRDTVVDDKARVLLLVTERGLAKRTSSHAFATKSRGGKGVRATTLNAKSGQLVAVMPVTDAEDIILATEQGKSIRIASSEVRLLSRSAASWKIMELAKDDKVASVLLVQAAPKEEPAAPAGTAAAAPDAKATDAAQNILGGLGVIPTTDADSTEPEA